MTARRILTSAAAALLWLAGPATAQMDSDFSIGGAVRVGSSTTTCNSAAGGAIRYVSNSLNFCDGATWRTIFSGTSTPNTPAYASGYGFLVLSSGTYTGNLGGLSGADASCVTDLTNNNWMNKTAASSAGIVNSTHIHAWLCDNTTCQNVYASQKYYFAVSGQQSVGGAYITADTQSYFGYTSGDYTNSDGYSWSGSNYFGGSYQYWTNRNSNYQSAAPSPGGGHCVKWTSATAGNSGQTGSSAQSDKNRWDAGTSACSNSFRLICIVQP